MKNNFKFSFLVILTCFTSFVSGQVITNIDIAAGLAAGTITATNSPFDGGVLANVFDQDFNTLARCNASNNPMVITLTFKTPQQFKASKVLSATPAEWTLESASSLSDLESKTGTYSLIVNKDPAVANVYDSIGFTIRTASHIRLTLKRTTSDFYPHLRGWELFGTPATDKNAPDFSVCYIKRLPQIDYVMNSTNPKVDGWPAAGSYVKWRAYVKSWSPIARNNIIYNWLWNDIPVDSGVVNFAPNGLAYADFNSFWSFDRNELTFVIDVGNAVKEVIETNNNLLIYTDAISLNLYVEESLYNYFHKYQRGLKGGNKSNSFEDWAQILHVSRWNRMFESIKSAEAPNGVLDRIRIDSIVVVPDNALPLNGGLPTNNPNLNDFSVDLQWGFPSSLLTTGVYADTVHVTYLNPFYFEGSLLHELGHARYVFDNYGYDVHDRNGDVLNIKENGIFIGGSQYLPKISFDAVHLCPHKGLMNGEYTYIDRYSAAAFNLIAGHRAVSGNCNLPGNAGAYLNDLPNKNILIISDSESRPISNADIRIYQSSPPLGAAYYVKYFDSIPEFTLISGPYNGKVVLPKNPFQTDGHINNPGEGIVLVRVETPTAIGYAFFESTWCNLAYWRGLTESATYSLKVKMIAKSIPVTRSGVFTSISDQITIFPNPASGSLMTLNVPESDLDKEILIFDLNSRVKYTGIILGNEHLLNIPIDDLKNGIYSLMIKDANGVTVKKFEVLK
ncbi:MAG: T9SS type A sorting domain-containing protein [Sporocytophaga sp.]|nr:T9SS type A sorting domain-containing protein [Sporocytophaga sp.]